MRAPWLLLLAACRGELVGDWEGECEIFYDPGLWLVTVELDITRERHGRATGEGSLVIQQDDLAQYTFEGPVTAEQSGSDMEFRLEGIEGGYLVVLEGGGKLKRDDIRGTCFVDYVGDAEGDLELNR